MIRRTRATIAAFATAALVLTMTTSATASVTQHHVIEGWVAYSQGGAQIDISIDATSPHGGVAALRIESSSPRAGGVFGGIAQAVPALPSTAYTISGWAKGDSIQGPQANRFVLNESWSEQRFLPDGTFAWTYFEWNLTTGATQTVIPLMLVGQDTGILWLDDLSIVQDGHGENLLVNGGFEQWQDRVQIENETLLFEPGDAQITLRSSAASVNWAVENLHGVIIDAGTESTPGTTPAVLDLDALPPGYYTLRLESGTFYFETSLVIYEDLDLLPTSGSPFGITAHPDYVPDFDMLPALVALGVDRVRFDLRWQHIEPTLGDYVFDLVADYDQFISELIGAGIRPLLILGYANPLYDGNERPYTPTGRAAYAAYAAAIAERYGDDVDYEIYNEYNHPGGYHLGPCGVTVSCYTDMLDEAALAIRTEVPNATIALTGLAGLTSWWIGGGVSELDEAAYDWLDEFLATASASEIDIVNIHNYSFPAEPEGNNDAVVEAVKDLMGEHVVANGMPLWLTETGWPTMGGLAGTVTEAEQARFLVRDAALTLAAGLDEYFVYGLLDDYAEETVEGRFGLFRNLATHGTLAPKPGALALAVMARKITGYSEFDIESVGSGVHAVVAGDGVSDSTRVLWSPSGATVTISTTGAVDVTTMYGEVTTLAPEGGVVTLTLGQDPIYLDGDSIASISVLSTPIYQAVAPTTARQGAAINVTVAIDLSDGGTVGAPVTFRGPGGSSVALAPIANDRAETTLTVPGYATLGNKSIPIRVERGSDVLTVMVTPTEVIANPQLIVQPALAPAPSTVGPLDIVIDYVSGGGITVSQIDYTVGGQFDSINPGTALPSGVPTTVSLPITGVWPWGPVYYVVTVTLSDSTVRTVHGITSFSAVYPDGTPSVPSADLSTSAVWVGAGAGNVAGQMWVSHDEDTVTVHAIIEDATHDPAGTPADLWQGDSIQFAFSGDRPGPTATSYSFGAALQGGTPVVYRYSGTPGVETSGSVSITRDNVNGVTSYAVTLPKAAVGLGSSEERFTYSFLVNDANGAGRVGYLEWGSGIGNVAGPSQYVPMVLVPEP